MADFYTVQSQRRGPWVTSPTTVIDAMFIGATTKPHNVYFEIPVPYDEWAAFNQQIPGGGTALAADGPAVGIETQLINNVAIGAAFVQAVDPTSSLLADYIEFTLAIPPGPNQTGPMTTTVRVPIGRVADPGIVQQYFEPAIAALTFTAGL